ncbi:hypothetical protein Leryth_020637 [Lithospermum erythrorhizon]|nr:hypothetical protein Leryth_020637 [Lithospermum erythrorhizon]
MRPTPAANIQPESAIHIRKAPQQQRVHKLKRLRNSRPRNRPFTRRLRPDRGYSRCPFRCSKAFILSRSLAGYVLPPKWPQEAFQI